METDKDEEIERLMKKVQELEKSNKTNSKDTSLSAESIKRNLLAREEQKREEKEARQQLRIEQKERRTELKAQRRESRADDISEVKELWNRVFGRDYLGRGFLERLGGTK